MIGKDNVKAHVLAIGNSLVASVSGRLISLESRVGIGLNPRWGIDVEPVANISSFSSPLSPASVRHA
jgi:hypothetical protein